MREVPAVRHAREVDAIRVDLVPRLQVFEQRIDYKALVDAEFRIAIGDDHIVFPVKPSAE